jgi:hypothetical protein
MHDIRPVSATPALRAKQPAVWLPLVSHGQLPYPREYHGSAEVPVKPQWSPAEARVKHQPETL